MKKFLTTLMLILSVVVWSRGSPVVSSATSLITAGSGNDANMVSVFNNNFLNTPDMELIVVKNDNQAPSFTDNDIILSTNTPNNEWADVDASKISYTTHERAMMHNQSIADLGGATIKKINLTDC